MASIKGNIILNGINTLTGVIFPIITFPYAARVLLPDGIGAVNFLNAIVSYIVLLTSLGIPMYAVKEVAKYRDDRPTRDRITVEILLLSTFLCLLGYIAVLLLAEFVPQIHSQASLFFILSLTILFTSIGVNWFYQGIEDFKFITIRAVVIRALAAAALFLFVEDSSDLLIYGVIVVGSTVGNNFINFVHLRKQINLQYIRFKELKIFRHLKPALQVFMLNLIISLYVQLNSIMLGFMSGDEAVGYFTAGTKISHTGLLLISSLGTVLLPRCSHLLQIGDMAGFKSVINKSLQVSLALSIPMTVGLMILATPITIVFCGGEFAEAVPVLLLNAPVVIFISLTNLIGIQVLYPMNKINLVIWSVLGGAIVNMVFNLILIPSYSATGAAVATLIAEFSVLLIQILLGRKYLPFKLASLFNVRYVLGSVIMCAAVYLSIFMLHTYGTQLLVGISTGMVVYATYLILSRDPLATELKAIIHRKLSHVK